MSKQASAAGMSERGVSIKHRRQKVSGKALCFAKYLLAGLDRISLTYPWKSEETLMTNSLDHKSFPSMTSWGCCLDHGVGVDYKLVAALLVRRMYVVCLKEQQPSDYNSYGLGLKPKSSKGNLSDEVVGCQQEQRQ